MVVASVPGLMRRFCLIPALALLAGCGGTENDGNPAFRANGEVIAFSGGDGGAKAACATCHGLKGEGDGRLTPRLAGLDPGYLQRQLDDYANGRREHAAMRAIALRLRGEDRARVSAYYAKLPGTGDPPARTSALYEAKCAQCHGARAEGMGPGNPALVGQSPAYIAAQIEAWRTGKRHDPAGVMMKVTRALAPAEVRLLAGDGVAPPPSARPPSTPAASR